MKEFNEAADYLTANGIKEVSIGIVLGTGLEQLLNEMDIITTISYADIPHFPTSTVSFHKGNLIYGKIAGKYVLIMQGRFHAYEGYSLQQIVFPIRVMKLLGIQKLLLSNAAGGINPDFKKGDLVLISDHINLLAGSPLSGPNHDELGERFTDMSAPYDADMRNLFVQKAKQCNIKFKHGVYAAVCGPNLETRAEYRYLRIIGADLVGMSTIPEVIAAVHMQLPCVAISVVTDECDPDNLKPINIAEIIEVAAKADQKLSAVIVAVIKEL